MCLQTRPFRRYILAEAVSKMLELKNIDSYYGESRVIEDLSFNVPKGKIVGFIGRNGVGKSTTLKSIMGIVKTPSGQVIFNGEDITKKPVY